MYIFSRMGDNRRALTLIIDDLEDVEMAIEFVRGVGDDDLWNDLVDQAKSKPGIRLYSKINGSFYQGIIGTCGKPVGSDKVGQEYPSRHEN